MQSDDPKIFVLSRELAEVHLLMDNLSADPEKSLSSLGAQAQAAGIGTDFVEKVCRVDWPPEDQAVQAALLIRTKDFLNQQTRPATGATIAFTLLVTQGGHSGQNRGWVRIWRGWLGRNSLPPGVRAIMEQESNSEVTTVDARTPSRMSLATLAYPGLVAKAREFRNAIFWMSATLFLALMLTCALSWYAAYGNTTLVQLASVQAAYDAAQKRVSDVEAPNAQAPDNSQHGQAPTSPQPNAITPAVSTSSPALSIHDSSFVTHLCNKPLLVPTTKAVSIAQPGTVVAQYDNVAEMQACGARKRALTDLDSVERRTLDWLHPLTTAQGSILQLLHKTHPRKYALQDTLAEDAEVSPDYGSDASSIATILSTAVLPFFYGLLGAGAAIIRSLSTKMQCSELAPRDLTLSLQRLALGAVVGTCVGLFVTSPVSGTQSSPGLLGPVGLSGSALSFVAGYSVESVFTALEGLISRIFTPSSTVSNGSGK